jgi:hypothetical protein
MTWFPDLGPLDYFSAKSASLFRSVGWLERDHEFAAGTVDEVFFERLETLLRDPFQPVVSAGVHHRIRANCGQPQVRLESTHEP